MNHYSREVGLISGFLIGVGIANALGHQNSIQFLVGMAILIVGLTVYTSSLGN